MARAGLRRLILALALGAVGTASAADRSVTIKRDDFGVPHIFAKDEAAGFYGLGYAMAEDRLERLLGNVMFARGELASIVGPAAVETDVQAGLWRHREMGQAAVAGLSPRLRRDYQAFIDGVQAHVAERKPPEPLARTAASLTVADMAGLPRALLYTGYHIPTARTECGLDGLAYSPGFFPYKRAAEGPASNGWVVAPSRTRDGALILSADPHIDTGAFVYYEYHMEAGPIRSAGFAMGPVLWQAHTADVAWAMTTGNPDYIDCYEVETDPADPLAYRIDGKVHRMETRTETIAVAGGEPVTRTFEYTRHNGILSPVVHREGTRAYVAVPADMHRAAELSEEFYRMNRARSVRELRGALSTMSMIPQNIVAGDRHGAIFYLRAGRTPIRPDGYDWNAPVPGNTAATAWRGYHSIADAVQVTNPPAGYLVNNNSAPDTMSASGALEANAYPADLFHDDPGRWTTRNVRAVGVLDANRAVTLEDAIALSFDETWVTAPNWIAALRYAVARQPERLAAASPEFRQAVDRLLAFDGKGAATSEAAADMWFWRTQAAGPVSALDDGAFVAWPWNPGSFTPALADVLLASLQRSLEIRQTVYGATRQQLGDVIRVVRGDVDAPVGGVSHLHDGMPVCVERARAVCDRTMRAYGVEPYGDKGRYKIARGSQALRVVEFGDPIRAYTLYAFGQSDDPTSPHYADQVPLISEGRPKQAYFTPEQLEGHVASEKTLVVPGRR